MNAEAALGRRQMLPAEIDNVLAFQLLVAWAGEAGQEGRLGWWQADLTSEFGGADLFSRLLPHSWAWATLEAAREAAIRQDAVLRTRSAHPDQLITIFFLGFSCDEQLEERLRALKRLRLRPEDALPLLASTAEGGWCKEKFAESISTQRSAEVVSTTIGRRIKGDVPQRLDECIVRLVSALKPLGEAYPMPHYRREK